MSDGKEMRFQVPR